jgi:hypothetical protein
MEALREKMHLYIEKYGPLDPRTILVSQELDKYIVHHMKGGDNIETQRP